MGFKIRLRFICLSVLFACFLFYDISYSQPASPISPFWAADDRIYYIASDKTGPGYLYIYQAGNKKRFLNSERIQVYKAHNDSKGIIFSKGKFWLINDLKNPDNMRLLYDRKDERTELLDLRWSADNSTLYYILKKNNECRLMAYYIELQKEERIFTLPGAGVSQPLFLFNRSGDKILYTDKPGKAQESWGNVSLFDINTRKNKSPVVKESVEKVCFTREQLLMVVKEGEYYIIVLDANYEIYRVLKGSADKADPQTPEYISGKEQQEVVFYGVIPVAAKKMLGWTTQGLAVITTDPEECRVILKENLDEMPVPGPKNRVLYKNGKGINVLNLDTLQSFRAVADGYDPHWSPDGRGFTYTVYKPDENRYYLEMWTQGKNSQLYLGDSMLGRWSTSGRYLAYISTKKSYPQLCILDTTSQISTELLELVTFNLQLASFSDKGKAQQLLDQFKMMMPDADFYIEPADLKEKGFWYRVRVGRFGRKEEAERFYAGLKDKWEKAKQAGRLAADWDGQMFIGKTACTGRDIIWLNGEDRLVIYMENGLWIYNIKMQTLAKIASGIVPTHKGVKAYAVSPGGDKILYICTGAPGIQCYDLVTKETKTLIQNVF